MKKIYVTITAIIFMVLISVVTALWNNGQQAMSNAAGPPTGNTGSPGDGATCVSCHTGSSVVSQIGWITSNIPGTGYVPNTTYSITASIPTQPGKTKFGFQVSPQSPTGTKLGTLISTSSATQLQGSGKYIAHTSFVSIGGGNSKSWSFQWTAPAVGTGTVTFYGAFNVTNSSATSAGDIIFTSKLVVPENTTSGIAAYDSPDKKINVFPTLVQSDLSIAYSLEKNAQVDIKIIDMNGRIVKQIISEKQSAGDYSLSVNCSGLSNGYYFVHSLINNKAGIEKIILSR